MEAQTYGRLLDIRRRRSIALMRPSPSDPAVAWGMRQLALLHPILDDRLYWQIIDLLAETGSWSEEERYDIIVQLYALAYGDPFSADWSARECFLMLCREAGLVRGRQTDGRLSLREMAQERG